MRRKALYISMSVLTIIFLVGMYVLKFWFPKEFMFAIQNEKIIYIGNFIDDRQWLYSLCCVITSTITYYIFICACSHRLLLKWYEILIIIFVSFLIRIIGLYVDTDIRNVLSWTSFAFLPAFMGGDLKTVGIVFPIHSLSQVLSIKIRNLPMYFTNTPNFVTTLCVGIECYLWLILMYIIFNFKKEKNNVY